MTTTGLANVSVFAQSAYMHAESDLSKSVARISSGMRITEAADDAAGVQIATRLGSQEKSFAQAVRNISDGMGLLDTAGGGYKSAANMLQQLRELSIQAVNGSNSDGDRLALDKEAKELLGGLANLSLDTRHNGVQLLDGNFRDKSFHIGAESGSRMDISLGSAAIKDLGVNRTYTTSSLAMGGTDTGILGGQDITVGSSLGTAVISIDAGMSAKDFADAVNSSTAGNGVTASARTAISIEATDGGAFDLTVNGVDLGRVAISDKDDLEGLYRAMVEAGTATGLSARLMEDGAKLIIEDKEGNDIELTGFAALEDSTRLKITALNELNEATGTTADVDFGYLDSTSGSAVTSAHITGQVQIDSKEGFVLESSDAAPAAGTSFMTSGMQASSFVSVSSIDLSTDAGASAGLGVIDAAISQMSSELGTVGAYSNRLEAAMGSVTTMERNVGFARSGIEDLDMARETVNLTRAKLLTDAAQSMLAQGNVRGESYLLLLNPL